MFHLITGGSSHGKSRYAEAQILEAGEGKRIYIATMNAHDPESKARIARHREMRSGKSFETIEKFTAIHELDIPKGCNILLEDMSNLIANEMFMGEGSGIYAYATVVKGLEHLLEQAENLVIVTNEVFSDGMQYEEETTLFLEYLGLINQHMGHLADRVTEVVYGIPVVIKDNTK